MIRARQDHDAEADAAFRRQALPDLPLALAASRADDFVSSPEAVRAQLPHPPEWGILGACRPGLIGAVGLFGDRHLKAFHKGQRWCLYVAPSHRRRGVATARL
jgi:ribosomal protein S18 acetylase RimI-like enzyme